jgi:nicotinate-nucleotide--dimethylbenzimidazole phosphoribosyltransferase
MTPLHARAVAAATDRQGTLLKPPGSLGRLEEIAIWMAGVTGDPLPTPRPLVIVAAADHGVAGEGVSAYPPAVTAQMLAAFLGGGSAIAALAGEQACPVWVVDAGVAGLADGWSDELIRSGLAPARNITREPALSPAELEVALNLGRELAGRAARQGFNLIVGGEMGIGNTTPATCLTAWLTGHDASSLCGRGTGIDDAGMERKRQAAATAVALHGACDDPLEALRRLGGGELAVLAGVALGAGESGIGFVCDGLIATAATAIAAAAEPGLIPRLVAGHRSPEPAHSVLLDHLGLDPLLDLQMRLGEASGAAVALALIRLACAAHREMKTFADAGVAGPS